MTDIIRAQIQKCPFLQNYFQPDKEQNEPAGRSSSQAAPVSVQTVTAIETKYQEQFTAFVDFLGFGEASTELAFRRAKSNPCRSDLPPVSVAAELLEQNVRSQSLKEPANERTGFVV
jgi:hypothetical protein